MKSRSCLFALAFFFATLTPCFAHHTAVIVNKDNGIGNMSAAHLAKIIRGEVKKWPNGMSIHLILHKDATGEAETLQRLNNMTSQEWKTFLEAHKDTIIFVDSDTEVLKAVQNDPGALGLVEVRSVDGTINIVRVDGKLPMEYGYLPH